MVGGQYQELLPNPQGWRWSQQLGLFLGIHDHQLRFFTPTGKLVETPEAIATIAQQELAAAQQELAIAQHKLAQERDQRQRLVDRLRELGLDPEET